MYEKEIEMTRRYWTEEELQLLREWYVRTDMFLSDMAARLGRHISQIYYKAHALGLKHPREIRL